MKNKLTTWVVIALILGIVTGTVAHGALDPKAAKALAGNFNLLTTVFLRMIKMIIAPLIFSTLVYGIASSDSKTVGRVGVKAMVLFLVAGLISLLIGMLFANILHPGVGYNLPLPTGASSVKTGALNLQNFLEHVFPKSFFEAMTNNEVLQIVVFSLFFGLAMGNLKHHVPSALLNVINDIAHVMLKLTGYVMIFAPFGVFGAIASTVTQQGLGILTLYASFMSVFVLGIVCLVVIIMVASCVTIGGKRTMALLKHIRTPLMLGFATASSEAAFPKLLEQLETFGVDSKIVGFVLPLGYSFNLAASAMYAGLAALFITQVYNFPMTLTQQFSMLLVLLVSSKGIAGVPRAGLVVVAAVLPMFGIPEAGVMLLLGIDPFVDMLRTVVNVLGNGIASAMVARMENQLGEPMTAAQAAEFEDGETAL